jgi:hypothetical protein
MSDPPFAIPGCRFGSEIEITLLDHDGTFTARRISEQGFMKLYREMTAHFLNHLLKRVLR